MPSADVIQPLHQADVAFPGQTQGVGQSERDAVAEAAVQGRLDRVIGLAKIREVEPDLAEATIRPQQVGRIGGGAGRAARGEGGILVPRQECRTEVHGIDVDLCLSPDFAELVEPVLPDIRDVDGRRPRQRHLHAGVPLRGRRNVRLVRPHRRQLGRTENLQARCQLLQQRVAHRARGREPRIPDLRVHGVAGGPIVEQPDPPAHDHPLRAADVVGEPEARRGHHGRPRVVVLGDAVAGAHDPVHQVARVRHDLSDQHAGRRPEQLPVAGIHRLTACAGAGLAPAHPVV